MEDLDLLDCPRYDERNCRHVGIPPVKEWDNGGGYDPSGNCAEVPAKMYGRDGCYTMPAAGGSGT